MKEYRNKEQVHGGKIKEIGGFLQEGGKFTCVLQMEDGSSQKEDYADIVRANARVGQYWVKTVSGQGMAMDADGFESTYAEV